MLQHAACVIKSNASRASKRTVRQKNDVMAWQVNKDVIAVGYGPYAFAPQLTGRVALWSLEDPAYPSWTFTTSSGLADSLFLAGFVESMWRWL